MDAMRALELTPLVCERAHQIASQPLPINGYLRLATFALARETIEGLELVTIDESLRAAREGL